MRRGYRNNDAPILDKVRNVYQKAAPHARIARQAATRITHMQASLEKSRGLDGRVALVTGSTSGIGLAIAEGLAAAGAKIVLNGFGSASDIAEICKTMSDKNTVPVIHDGADMSDPAAIAAMFDRTAEKFGMPDIVVNNAGIQHVAPIEEFPLAKWDAIIAINLSAVFHATRAVLPSMKARGWGRIVNIASAHGLIGSAFKGAYVAAKHGVVGFTKVTALEAAEHGVTCNAVCPGYVWTPLVEQQVEAQAKAHDLSPDQVVREIFLKEQPTRKFATVEEIAQTTLFLCSPGAASITGTTIAVDGGWTAH
jgi:3-hydroxybutyrate dehydrogenase